MKHMQKDTIPDTKSVMMILSGAEIANICLSMTMEYLSAKSKQDIFLLNRTGSALMEKGNNNMNFEKAMKILIVKLGEARRNETVIKPLAWALYQTWKVVEEKERPVR